MIRSRSAGRRSTRNVSKPAPKTSTVPSSCSSYAKVPFIGYAREWVETYAGRTSRGFREVTRDDYRRRLGLDTKGNPAGEGAVSFFGRTPLSAITPRDLKRFGESLAARGLARNTVRLHLAPVKALLATALEEGLIRTNPAAGLRIANRQHEYDEEKVKALTEDELRQLLRALPAGWRLFFEFLAHTGLRIGEAIALRWSDIDLNQRRITIERRFYQGSFAPPKSRFGRRTIPLSPTMARELELRFLMVEDVEELVFSSERGTVLDASNLMSRVLKPAARTAGVPWAGFHTFRHTCATTLFRRGLNAKQVQVWLGHHSPAFTLATYVHLIPDDLPEADFLDEVTARPDEKVCEEQLGHA
jgi:integrase